MNYVSFGDFRIIVLILVRLCCTETMLFLALIDLHYLQSAERAKTEVSESLINRINDVFSDGIHFATPISSLRTNETDLVRPCLGIICS